MSISFAVLLVGCATSWPAVQDHLHNLHALLSFEDVQPLTCTPAAQHRLRARRCTLAPGTSGPQLQEQACLMLIEITVAKPQQ
jgi:hypothetical protein